MRTKKNETTNKNKVAKLAVASFGAALTTVMGGNIQGAVVDLTANLPSGSHPGGGGGEQDAHVCRRTHPYGIRGIAE